MKPKRMLEIKKGENGDIIWYVNSSTLDMFMSCPRKAQYRVMMGLAKEGKEDSDALLFGRSIHKGLQSWYSPGGSFQNDDQAVAAFMREGALLERVDPSHPTQGARALPNGERILRFYFDRYRNDRFEVATLDGKPAVELDFEKTLIETPSKKIKIVYHGTIDCIWREKSTGRNWVVDHKTSRSLGEQFAMMMKPRHQFTGYLWAAKELGFDPVGVIANGIQVAKTKCDLVRLENYRHAAEIQEWKMNVQSVVGLMSQCISLSFYPQRTDECSEWGGCLYRNICEALPEDRLKVIGNLYPEAMKNGVPA